MKTTLELPDPLMRALKVRAANTDRKLKDVVADLIERGLKHPANRGAKQRPGSASATKAALSPPLKLKTGRMLSIEEIEAAIADGRYAHYKSLDEVNAYMDELRADRDEVSR